VSNFSWLIALCVFIAYFCIDFLMAYYTMAVVAKRAVMASTSGAVIYLMTSYGVINYTQNYWYIIPIVLGSWLGTYTYVKRSR